MLPNKIDFTSMSKHDIQEFIVAVEKEAFEVDENFKVELPLKHHFSKGVYAREIHIPTGHLIVGKIHKHENLNILSQGELTVISIDGCFKLKAPATFVSSPGVKRLAFVHEDVVWTTVHGTDETDLEKIEEEFIVKSYDDLIENKEVLWLGQR